jgi:hypothetical protein
MARVISDEIIDKQKNMGAVLWEMDFVAALLSP